jgi:hypothetical protein
VRIHALPLASAGLLLALAVSACSSSPAPRTAPDQVERAAVTAAQGRSLVEGSPIAEPWTQLWTPTQAGTEIASCVKRGSDGLIVFRPSPLAGNSQGLSYSVEMIPKDTTVGGGVGPPFFDGSTAERLVGSCIARYPVDFRLFSVPEKDRAALYAYDLTVLRRCLLAHGQLVPAMPDRERFENMLRASAPWNAYEQVKVPSRAEWYALVDACPALPPPIAREVADITAPPTTPWATSP